MNYLVAFLLLVVVYMLTNENESYGFSGYTVPRETQLMDPFPNLIGFEEVKNDATADLMESVVLLTNKEIHKRTGISNYIIETTSMKKYRKQKEEPATVYECRFMTVKKNGFSFGFSVVVWFIVEEQKPIRLLAIRSQPIGFNPRINRVIDPWARNFLTTRSSRRTTSRTGAISTRPCLNSGIRARSSTGRTFPNRRPYHPRRRLGLIYRS